MQRIVSLPLLHYTRHRWGGVLNILNFRDFFFCPSSKFDPSVAAQGLDQEENNYYWIKACSEKTGSTWNILDF